jgi:hypothetical protein
MDHDESKRIHQDYWGQCRTCRWWGGDRASGMEGRCTSPRSELSGSLTQRNGYCENEWDSFDVDVALEIMGENDDA